MARVALTLPDGAGRSGTPRPRPTAGLVSAGAYRSGGSLTVSCEPGHAWFGRLRPAPAARRSHALHGTERLATAGGIPEFAPPVRKRALRVPDRDVVSVLSRPALLSPPAADVPRIGARRPETSPAASIAAQPSRSAGPWRTAFFMTMLAVTLAITWWAGRMTGWENVIVVPAPEKTSHRLA